MTANRFDPKSSAQDHIAFICKEIIKYITIVMKQKEPRTLHIRAMELSNQAEQVVLECRRLQKLIPNLIWLPNAIEAFASRIPLDEGDLPEILDIYCNAKMTDFTNNNVHLRDTAFNFDALFRQYYMQDNFDQIFTDIADSFECILLSPDCDAKIATRDKKDIRTLIDFLRKRNSPSLGVVQNLLMAIRTFIAAVFPDFGIMIAGIDVAKKLLELVEEGEKKATGISERMYNEFGEHFNNQDFLKSYKPLSYSPKGDIKHLQEPSRLDTVK